MAIWSRNGNFPSIPRRRRRLFSFVGQTTLQNHPIPSYQATTMTLSTSHRSIRRIPDPPQHCSSSPLNLQCSSTATTAHRTPASPLPNQQAPSIGPILPPGVGQQQQYKRSSQHSSVATAPLPLSTGCRGLNQQNNIRIFMCSDILMRGGDAMTI